MEIVIPLAGQNEEPIYNVCVCLCVDDYFTTVLLLMLESNGETNKYLMCKTYHDFIIKHPFRFML